MTAAAGPSRAHIVRATLAAAAVALLVVLGAVLPAEFGIDPLRTGKALGLLALYEADEATPAAAAPDEGVAGPASEYRVDTRELKLGPGQSFEFKYRLAKGDGMVYVWSADGRVTSEFHGEPSDRALKVQTYDKRDDTRGSGTLTAPFAGIHGWYWENRGERELTISLRSAGFFTTAEEFRPKWDPVRRKERIEQTTHDIPRLPESPAESTRKEGR
jgi:hypothetical protein